MTTNPKGVNPNSQNKKYSSTTTNSGLDNLEHGICLEKQFSIVFYIVLDSTNVSSPNYPNLGIASPANLDSIVKWANEAFKPICVSFVSCSTVYIPNFNYGKTWLKNSTEGHVTSTYYTDKTINFYLVDSLSLGGGNIEPEGYTYEPSLTNLSTPKKDVMVLDKYKIVNGRKPTINHLFGHFFGLPHTFDELNPTPAAVPPPPASVVSQEFVTRTNCHTHGDLFCDTEADNGGGTAVSNVDGMGNFYIPPVDNYMSFHPARQRFTQEQYNWMANTIITKRLYLH